MKLVLADPSCLRDSVNVISELVTEARIKVTSDGLDVVAMDPANVAMVIFKLFSSSFSEFVIDGPLQIGINFSSLRQVLKRASQSDILILEVTKGNELNVVLKGPTTRTFSIPLLDIDDKEQKIPTLSFVSIVETPSLVLNNAIADADIVGESVSFIAEKGTFVIQAEGDLSKASIEVKEGPDTKITLERDAKVRAKYSIEYLKKMIAAGKLCDNVIIKFSQDYPLLLEYNVVDTMQLAFILAPRVEND